MPASTLYIRARMRILGALCEIICKSMCVRAHALTALGSLKNEFHKQTRTKEALAKLQDRVCKLKARFQPHGVGRLFSKLNQDARHQREAGLARAGGLVLRSSAF